MKHTLTFGPCKFTRNKDGRILVERGADSVLLPSDLPFTFADLQRLAQTPQKRHLLSRLLNEYLK